MAGTTLDDVKAVAEVSGSQMYHYFPNKNDLVQAVVNYQADATVTNQRHADLGSVQGVQAWRDMVIMAAERVQAKGGCPLGSLGGQLAESDPEARSLIAAGFERWTTEISEGLRSLRPAASSRPASTRMTSPSPCSPRSREDFSSPRYNGAPARSKLRSIPSSPSSGRHRRYSPMDSPLMRGFMASGVMLPASVMTVRIWARYSGQSGQRSEVRFEPVLPEYSIVGLTCSFGCGPDAVMVGYWLL